MAGLRDLLQQIARSVEDANARQPSDDLRARLGYGAEDEEDDDETLAAESIREPEAERAQDAEPAPAPATARKLASTWMPPKAPRPTVTSPASPARAGTPGARHPPRPAPSVHHAPPSPASMLSQRVRARLRTPDALREAFVLKELLDRPRERRLGR